MKKNILRDVFYSLSCNTTVMIISVIMALFLPKFLSLKEYGMWQLFLFYFSYVGFLQFGLEDGIYLRYAGISYADLDKSMIYGQSIFIFIMQLLLSALMLILTKNFIMDASVCSIFQMLSIVIVLANMNNLFSFIFQMTSRIKDYAHIASLEPIAFLIAAIFVLVLGRCNAYNLIFCKILSLSLSCCLSIFILRDIWHYKLPDISNVLSEAWANISVGSKLMLANIASMLVIGVVRYGISRGWDVIVFGKVSLTLSISNFLLVFINAISVVLLPTIRHVDEQKRIALYDTIRILLTTAMMILLILYYPIYIILELWLPQYADTLQYMAILFPICLTESRMSLLINTYLKAMRQEKMMLHVNFASVIFSACITYICVVTLHNLLFCIFSIVLIFAFKAYWAEWNLCRIMHERFIFNMLSEIAMLSTFIFTSWGIGGIRGFFGYLLFLTVYLLVQKKQIHRAYCNLFHRQSAH